MKFHVFSNKACEFKYTHGTNKLEKQNSCQLDDHEGRIHVAGDYEKHECGMKISRSILNDAGEWRVEVSTQSKLNYNLLLTVLKAGHFEVNHHTLNILLSF